MKIQFILCQFGASHKYLGHNVVNGLRQLGVQSEFYYCQTAEGRLLTDPDHTFFLKPHNDDEIRKYRGTSGKNALIMNDYWPQLDYGQFDFLVSPSIAWKELIEKQEPAKKCYLVLEEIDYMTSKVHEQSEKLKIVTTGYSTNLKRHFIPIAELIRNIFDDITVVTDVNFDLFIQAGCKTQKFVPKRAMKNDSDYDRIMVEQFKEFDVGIVTQYKYFNARTSNRAKLFMYAGLPVVCTNSENHVDLWFNGVANKNLIVTKESEWVSHLTSLRDASRRQEISDYNTSLSKQFGGIVNSAKSFLAAIEKHGG